MKKFAFQEFMNKETETISIVVTEKPDGVYFYPTRDRESPPQKILHPDVLDEPALFGFNEVILKHALGDRYGYDLPELAFQALTDDWAHRQWRLTAIEKKLKTTKKQLKFGAHNGNNSFVKHQIQALQQEQRTLMSQKCPHCRATMKPKVYLTFFREELKQWECPACRYTMSRGSSIQRAA